MLKEFQLQMCNQDSLVRGGIHDVDRTPDYLIEDLSFVAGTGQAKSLMP